MAHYNLIIFHDFSPSWHPMNVLESHKGKWEQNKGLFVILFVLIFLNSNYNISFVFGRLEGNGRKVRSLKICTALRLRPSLASDTTNLAEAPLQMFLFSYNWGVTDPAHESPSSSPGATPGTLCTQHNKAHKWKPHMVPAPASSGRKADMVPASVSLGL